MDNNTMATNRQVRFGKWLKSQREYINLKQRELADILNVTPTYISKIENAKTEVMPSILFLNLLAPVFRLRPIEVMNQAGVYDRRALSDLLDKNPELAIEINSLINSWKVQPHGK